MVLPVSNYYPSSLNKVISLLGCHVGNGCKIEVDERKILTF